MQNGQKWYIAKRTSENNTRVGGIFNPRAAVKLPARCFLLRGI